ncbi:hypothetical protein SB6411_02345 [Klebsiella spallanzanii]|uniref:Lipoprotein n=1 Tax=Klebsiella spallanzanii TaxID=2587528 RepID=A0ABY6VF94_9ENTR|nr:hypothetical protein [Klebsiella spallanzanii]VUS69836.1 hypothetical protein SB6411_02345 [Klebsiella spallanzanii]
MSLRLLILTSVFGLTACGSNQAIETFKGTPGTAGMAYCVRSLWEHDAIENNHPTGIIHIMENRSGTGSFYVFDDKSAELVSAKGTYGFWPGEKPKDIDITFYIPKDKSITALGKRRLELSKKCAALPTQVREDTFLPSVICTDKTSCRFRDNLPDKSGATQ